MDRIRETFVDGRMEYGRFKDKLSEKKKRIGKEFVKEGKLFFRELSIREQDYQFAKGLDTQLDLKIKTPYPSIFRGVKKRDLIGKINGEFFDVVKVDHDRFYLYFYLTKVGDPSDKQGTNSENEQVSRGDG